MTINAYELAKALSLVMTEQDKKFFLHLMDNGNIETAKRTVRNKSMKHVTEQIIIGSHVSTAPAMQQELSDIAYSLLKNNTELRILQSGEIVEQAL